jgi:hypothetical protein
VPVIKLKKDHYAHKSYGRIFTPVFQLVEWVGMDAESEPEELTPESALAASVAEESPAPAGRRRRAA